MPAPPLDPEWPKTSNFFLRVLWVITAGGGIIVPDFFIFYMAGSIIEKRRNVDLLLPGLSNCEDFLDVASTEFSYLTGD